MAVDPVDRRGDARPQLGRQRRVGAQAAQLLDRRTRLDAAGRPFEAAPREVVDGAGPAQPVGQPRVVDGVVAVQGHEAPGRRGVLAGPRVQGRRVGRSAGLLVHPRGADEVAAVLAGGGPGGDAGVAAVVAQHAVGVAEPPRRPVQPVRPVHVAVRLGLPGGLLAVAALLGERAPPPVQVLAAAVGDQPGVVPPARRRHRRSGGGHLVAHRRHGIGARVRGVEVREQRRDEACGGVQVAGLDQRVDARKATADEGRDAVGLAGRAVPQRLRELSELLVEHAEEVGPVDVVGGVFGEAQARLVVAPSM